MWTTLFTVVLVIAFGLGLGALVLETYGEKARIYGRRPGRNLHATARYLRAAIRS